MNGYLLLTVDDDPDILRTNKKYLENKGYAVHTAARAKEALLLLEQHHYVCILLDVMLPDMDGYELCQAIRQRSDAPILFVSCLDGEEDKVRGLMAGGEDYITKPYSLKELAARVHAQVRRFDRMDFSIDYEREMLVIGGRGITLTPREFGLFLHLYSRPDTVFSPEVLYRAQWNRPAADPSNTVAVYIRRLREKLARYEWLGAIETVRGEGYRFHPGQGWRGRL